jgi:hypothetical protein
MWGSYNFVAEDSSLMGLWRVVLDVSEDHNAFTFRIEHSKQNLLSLLDCKDEGTLHFRNVENY